MRAARLGEFEVDLRTRVLRRGGRDVPLQDQPFRILELLLGAPDHTLTRDQLTAALWPAGTYVDFDRGLNTAINKLRVALGDSADSPRYIESIGRHAYRLIVPAHRHHAAAAIAISLAVVVLVAAVVVGLTTRHAPHIRSVAVLPLDNLSTSPADAFLADGITDEVITRLAQAKDLQVISRQSILRFRNVHIPMSQIASQLGVDAVIEGTVARSGNRVRVTAQLIDGRTDRHLWASAFEREMSDVLALQDDIARGIAAQVGATLVRGAPAAPLNSEAYIAYLSGRYESNKLPPNFDGAIALFQQAIEREPRMAVAYAGLANCYAGRANWQSHPPVSQPTDASTARSFALESLRLDPANADAYTTLGYLDLREFAYRRAEENFRHAIDLNPSASRAHELYALQLIRFRRFDEAIREAHAALQTDPTSIYAHNIIAGALGMSGRNAEAVDHLRMMLRLYPRYADGSIRFKTALLLHDMGHDREAADEFVLSLDPPPNVAYTGTFADRLRAYLRDPAASGDEGHWNMALIHAVLADRDDTLRELEKCYEAHENEASMLNADDHFNFVRSDPRFQALIAKMNLQ